MLKRVPVIPKRDCWVAWSQLLKNWVAKEDGYRNMTTIHTMNITHIANFRTHFAQDTTADGFPVAGNCSSVAGRSGWWVECSLSMELQLGLFVNGGVFGCHGRPKSWYFIEDEWGQMKDSWWDPWPCERGNFFYLFFFFFIIFNFLTFFFFV